MFRILRMTGAMVVYIVACFIGSYPVYLPMTILLAIYLVLELISLCVEAEIRTRIGLQKPYQPAQYRLGRETTAKVRQGFRKPFCWLPGVVLQRISLWMYFW